MSRFGHTMQSYMVVEGLPGACLGVVQDRFHPVLPGDEAESQDGIVKLDRARGFRWATKPQPSNLRKEKRAKYWHTTADRKTQSANRGCG